MTSVGSKVGRALQALERAADALGQRPGQHRLGDAGHVFEQNVPLAEIGDQGQRDLLPLADDDLLDIGDDFLGRGRHVGGFRGCVGFGHERVFHQMIESIDMIQHSRNGNGSQ